MRKVLELLLLFVFMLGVFLIMLERPAPPVVEPTPTPLPTLTPVPTLTPAPPLPTSTNPPPIVVQPNLIIIPAGDTTFNDVFFTAIVCVKVPVFSQPLTDWHLWIGELYPNNQVEVTGQSQYWSRIAYLMADKGIGYTITEYFC